LQAEAFIDKAQQHLQLFNATMHGLQEAHMHSMIHRNTKTLNTVRFILMACYVIEPAHVSDLFDICKGFMASGMELHWVELHMWVGNSRHGFTTSAICWLRAPDRYCSFGFGFGAPALNSELQE